MTAPASTPACCPPGFWCPTCERFPGRHTRAHTVVAIESHEPLPAAA